MRGSFGFPVQVVDRIDAHSSSANKDLLAYLQVVYMALAQGGDARFVHCAPGKAWQEQFPGREQEAGLCWDCGFLVHGDRPDEMFKVLLTFDANEPSMHAFILDRSWFEMDGDNPVAVDKDSLLMEWELQMISRTSVYTRRQK